MRIVFDSGPFAPLRENMTSSTKPEVHNLSYCEDTLVAILHTLIEDEVMLHVRPWRFSYRLTFTFDLLTSACQATAIEYTCTTFGVDSSSRFLIRARRIIQTDNRQTDASECPTHNNMK